MYDSLDCDVVQSCGWVPTSDFNPEDGSDKFYRNVGNNLQDYTASQPRRPQSTIHQFACTMWIQILHVLSPKLIDSDVCPRCGVMSCVDI
jgi:hypothetical protein